MEFAQTFANRVNVPGTGKEVISILMDRYRHDSISCEESLFNSISMMDINIYVQHSGVMTKKIENAYDYVIDVTKPGGLELFGVV